MLVFGLGAQTEVSLFIQGVHWEVSGFISRHGGLSVESTSNDWSGQGAVIADRYEILGVLGEGGAGTVFVVLDHNTGEEVALKMLHPRYAAHRDCVARFMREIALARQLDHPGIVKLYEMQNSNECMFYTMEYLRGKTLRDWLADRRLLDFDSAVQILCLVADALEHAHQITIHRDLSPENIMVLPDGSVRLLDFGVAKLNDQFEGLTMTGSTLGKLMYMAPEQELDASGVDHRADLYSLGVIFFELLVGRTPLPGREVRDFCPHLPPEIDDFFRKALARRPEDRFSSAREMREAMLRLQDLYRASVSGAPVGTASLGIVARVAAFSRNRRATQRTYVPMRTPGRSRLTESFLRRLLGKD